MKHLCRQPSTRALFIDGHPSMKHRTPCSILTHQATFRLRDSCRRKREQQQHQHQQQQQMTTTFTSTTTDTFQKITLPTSKSRTFFAFRDASRAAQSPLRPPPSTKTLDPVVHRCHSGPWPVFFNVMINDEDGFWYILMYLGLLEATSNVALNHRNKDELFWYICSSAPLSGSLRHYDLL